MKLFARYHRERQCGTTTFEALVSFTLLTTTMAVSVPMIVRHGQLLASQREYRLALDELSNQLERLGELPRPELARAVGELRPSEYTAARLHGAKLRGELQPADVGERLTLHITWDEPQRSAAPVSLAAWISPRPLRQPPAEQLAEGELP